MRSDNNDLVAGMSLLEYLQGSGEVGSDPGGFGWHFPFGSGGIGGNSDSLRFLMAGGGGGDGGEVTEDPGEDITLSMSS